MEGKIRNRSHAELCLSRALANVRRGPRKLETTPESCAEDEQWPHAPQCVGSAQGKMGSCRRIRWDRRRSKGQDGSPVIREQLGWAKEVLGLEQSAMDPRGSRGWMGLDERRERHLGALCPRRPPQHYF